MAAAEVPSTEVDRAYKQVEEARVKVDAALADWKNASSEDKPFYEKQLDAANRQLEIVLGTYDKALKGTADPEIAVQEGTANFWRSARSGQLNLSAGHVLEVPGNLYRAEHRVFVRESYVELAAFLVNLLVRGGKAHAGVYGTPGTGKSVFASLLVGFIGLSAPESVVLYHAAHTMSEKGFLAFFPDGGVRYVSVDEGRALVSRMANAGQGPVWVIADGKKPPEGVMATEFSNVLRTVTVSSSNMQKHQWLYEWDKHVNVATLMPPFSLQELLLAAELKVTPQTEEALRQLHQHVHGRWLVFGGVPRGVLDDDKWKIAKWLDDSVPRNSDTLLKALRDTAHGHLTQSTDGNKSRIIHLYPGPPERAVAEGCHWLDYNMRVARFASPVVCERLIANLDEASRLEAARRLSNADKCGDDSEAVALLFEPWMHAFIRRNCSFYSSAHAAACPLVQLALGGRRLDLEYFPSSMSLCDAPVGRYMQPESASYPSIDSFVKFADGSVRLFQMTGQESHPINMPGLKALFAVPPGTPGGCDFTEGGHPRCVLVPDNTVLVFVIMPRRAQTFVVPQPFVSKGRGAALECSRNPERYIATRIAQMKAWPESWDQN